MGLNENKDLEDIKLDDGENESEDIRENGSGLQFSMSRTKNRIEKRNGLALLLVGESEYRRDSPKPTVFYQKAAQLSNARELYTLAVSLQRGTNEQPRNVPDAVPLYRQAIELGLAAAANDLAVVFERGEGGVPPDMAEAVVLYERAAKMGHTLAMKNLARLFFCGAAVTKDEAAAYDWYLKAANKGDSEAMNNVAILLLNRDEGTSETLSDALGWYKKAVDHGNATAMFNLGASYRDGSGVKENLEEAVKLFRQGAAAGEVNAMCALAILMEHGSGTRRDVPGAVNLLERAAQTDPSNFLVKTSLARLLLSDEGVIRRQPEKAAELLEECLRLSPTFGYALHELAVYHSLGKDVPVDKAKAEKLFSKAASQSSFEAVQIYQSERLVIDAGEYYPSIIKNILSVSVAKPRTCLLLTLGGGCRGKTSTVNSLRGMHFEETHIPTEMAAINKFVLEPGVRGLTEDIILEYDFNENSLRATASRLHKEIVSQSEMRERAQNRSDEAARSIVPNFGTSDASIFKASTGRHADVIERVRRSLMLAGIPTGFKGSVVQVWDMAGQSRYEMAHSLVIARGSILLFVTDLTRVAEQETRKDEVGLLCYWMQLAHFLVPDPSRIRVLVVGTRKAQCDEKQTLKILKECLEKQLASKVYDSWIRRRQEGSVFVSASKFIAIENSQSSADAKVSGLDELERAVQEAGDEVVAARDAVPLRWLAFVDKLEREHQKRNCLHFERTHVLAIGEGFPGFVEDGEEREQDILEGLRCYASMGRLVLFELDKQEWYVFVDVQMITNVLGKLTAPEERLRDLLSQEDIQGLADGRISQPALFSLWGDYSEEEDKRLMLKILCRFDLLLLLTGNDDSIVKGDATIGIPAMMKSGWEDFRWGHRAGEKDLEVVTVFEEEGIPNGLISFLISHIHRKHVAEGNRKTGIAGASLRVRADAFLIRARDGSRVFLGFKAAERKLVWKFRGLTPVILAKEFIGGIEKLENSAAFLMNAPHKHVVALDCVKSLGGCDTPGAVEIELTKQWLLRKGEISLPLPQLPCGSCLTSMPLEVVSMSLWPKDSASPDAAGMQRVMPEGRFDVFLSHASPDKLALAQPLYQSLTWQRVRAFLDMEVLQILDNTAPEEMDRAMREAPVGVFILSPEFVARPWPMKELRCFLKRDRVCRLQGGARPVILPIFYRLTLKDCSECDTLIFGEGSRHHDTLVSAGFFEQDHQNVLSTEDAIWMLKEVKNHSGVEVSRVSGGEDLSSAGVMTEIVRRVVDYMRLKGLLPTAS